MEITCQTPAKTMITCQVPDDGPGAIDWITAIGTILAVVIAAIAIGMTQRSIGRERRHQRLVERHRAAVELLNAFEATLGHRTKTGIDPGMAMRDAMKGIDRDSPELKDARARYKALLWASEEPLPINRNLTFDHIKLTDEELAGKRVEGDAELEVPKVRASRGEIVAALEGLRTQMDKG